MTESALDFRFDWEPVDDSVQAPELRATWARLQIWVRQACVTLVEDRPTGSVRRSIAVSLYPLAEWITFNRWLLMFDARRDGGPTTLDRRSLRSAGDGFNWPDLHVTPAGEAALISWDAPPILAGDASRYLTYGSAWIDAVNLQATLDALVRAVLLRLEEAGIHGTPLQDEWNALTNLDDEEAEFCQASARLGLDPFAEGTEFADEIIQASEGLAPSLSSDFFDAADPGEIGTALSWIADSLSETNHTTRPEKAVFPLDLVRDAAHRIAQNGAVTPPWLVGYDAARVVRRELRMDPTDPLADGLPVAILVRPANVAAFTGVGATRRQDDWTSFAIARQTAAERTRFAAARALWHSVGLERDDPYLLTSSRSTRQQIGRAFAAELLAPAEGIRQVLARTPTQASDEDIALAGAHFQASDMVIAHQIENQLQRH